MPILLIVLAMIVNIGIQVKWKVRAVGVSRQAVWRQRGGRHGATDPVPVNWRVQNATMGVTPVTEPPLFPNDPFAQHAVTRGPVLRVPNGGDPQAQLQVDQKLLDIASDVEQGWAKITRDFPFLPRLRRVNLDVKHPLLDSLWRYWEMGFGSNRGLAGRRAIKLYTFTPPGYVRNLAFEFQEAAIAILTTPLRRQLAPLDRDEEFIAWYGPPPPDFHPQLELACTLDAFEMRAGPVQRLIDQIQGPMAGGLFGVPDRMSNAWIAMYRQQINQLQNQKPPPQGQIDALRNKIEQLERFRGTLR